MSTASALELEHSLANECGLLIGEHADRATDVKCESCYGLLDLQGF